MGCEGQNKAEVHWGTCDPEGSFWAYLGFRWQIKESGPGLEGILDACISRRVSNMVTEKSQSTYG